MMNSSTEHEDKNGYVHSNLWRCPGCGRIYLNTDYCYKCDVLQENEESN